MTVTPIVLRFADQLMSVSAVLVSELQQLVASIQVMIASLVAEIKSIEAGWVDLPYAPTNYSPNSAGLITTTNAAPNVFRYKLIGKTLLLNCSVKVTIGNASTTEIRFRIPTGPQRVTGLPGVGDDTQMTAGVYSDSSGVAGVVMVAINTIGAFISVQRYDGAPSAVFVNGRTYSLGFMVQIPLA